MRILLQLVFSEVTLFSVIGLVSSCDLREAAKCTEDILRIFKEKGTNTQTLKDGVCHLKIYPVQSCLLKNVGDCPEEQNMEVKRLKEQFRDMHNNITELCQPGCDNFSSRSTALRDCALDLKRKLQTAENKELLCSNVQVMMSCAKKEVGTCPSLRKVYKNSIIPLQQIMEPECNTSTNIQWSSLLILISTVLVTLSMKYIGAHG